jgi:hypothetical protein
MADKIEQHTAKSKIYTIVFTQTLSTPLATKYDAV